MRLLNDSINDVLNGIESSDGNNPKAKTWKPLALN